MLAKYDDFEVGLTFQEWRDLVALLDLSTNLFEIIGKIEKLAAGADFSDFFYTPRLENSKLKKKNTALKGHTTTRFENVSQKKLKSILKYISFFTSMNLM